MPGICSVHGSLSNSAHYSLIQSWKRGMFVDMSSMLPSSGSVDLGTCAILRFGLFPCPWASTGTRPADRASRPQQRPQRRRACRWGVASRSSSKLEQVFPSFGGVSAEPKGEMDHQLWCLTRTACAAQAVGNGGQVVKPPRPHTVSHRATIAGSLVRKSGPIWKVYGSVLLDSTTRFDWLKYRGRKLKTTTTYQVFWMVDTR